jgi:hypothetical protein
MTLTNDRTSNVGPPEVEVLFPEARRRRRRRYGYSATIVVVTVCVGLALFLALGGSPARKTGARPPRPTVHRRPPPPVSSAVVPKQPGPLALGSNGDLYVADGALSEILERLPTGKFKVIAGDGKAGYSGDNGPATDAQLNAPGGMAVSSNGTIYLADGGNDRIRAIAPDGTITTVAGNGQVPAAPFAIASDSPATDVAIGDVTAVTIGPGGSVFFTALGGVMELGPSGTLSTIVTENSTIGVDHAQPDAYCGPDALAFGGSGDLYIGCSNVYYVLERTAAGGLVDRGALRPHDANAAITSGPDGSVIGLYQSSVQQYTATQDLVITDFLAAIPGIGDFWPQGVAVAPNGTLYFDQDGISGIGPPAIVAYSPSGAITKLWSAPSSPG